MIGRTNIPRIILFTIWNSVFPWPKKLCKNLLWVSILCFFTMINSDVLLTRTAKLQPSNIVKDSSRTVHLCMLSVDVWDGAPLYAVSTCEASSHGWTFSHHQSLTIWNQPSCLNCIFRPWRHVDRLRWTTMIMCS